MVCFDKTKEKKTHLNIQCDLWHKEEKIIDICGQMEFVFFGILKEKFDKQEMIWCKKNVLK